MSPLFFAMQVDEVAPCDRQWLAWLLSVVPEPNLCFNVDSIIGSIARVRVSAVAQRTVISVEKQFLLASLCLALCFHIVQQKIANGASSAPPLPLLSPMQFVRDFLFFVTVRLSMLIMNIAFAIYNYHSEHSEQQHVAAAAQQIPAEIALTWCGAAHSVRALRSVDVEQNGVLVYDETIVILHDIFSVGLQKGDAISNGTVEVWKNNRLALLAFIGLVHYALHCTVGLALASFAGLSALQAACVVSLVYEKLPSAVRGTLNRVDFLHAVVRLLVCGLFGRLLIGLEPDSSRWSLDMTLLMTLSEFLLRARSVTIAGDGAETVAAAFGAVRLENDGENALAELRNVLQPNVVLQRAVPVARAVPEAQEEPAA